MAVYKVPQDVEAEDKLLGPFSFRQFIYLIVAALGIITAVMLYRVFPGLVVIPIPIIIALLALALPLRKDQPMETYLLAMLRFYLKPRVRLWNQDGTLISVEITAPKVVEEHLTKDITQDQARDRLDYLARIMDSRGWSIKGVDANGDGLYDTVSAEASTANDIMDEHAGLAKSFDALLAQKNQQSRDDAMQKMRDIAARPAAATAVAPPRATNPVPQRPPVPGFDPDLHFNPYPTNMHQHVVQPVSQQQLQAQAAAAAAQNAQQTAQQPVPQPVSPAIISLANNNDLSISAIAHEAHRLADQEGEEVVISLR